MILFVTNVCCNYKLFIDLGFFRASKSCRRAEARLRKIFKNLLQMCTFEGKLETTGI